MRVTYYALRQVQVRDETRQAGDLVPEAAAWPALPGYVQDGWLAPVLVATLPEAVQKVLLAWEMSEQPGDPGEDDSGDDTEAPAEEQPLEAEPPQEDTTTSARSGRKGRAAA